MQGLRYLLAVLVALLSIPGPVFFLSFTVLWRMVQAEYASGERISTNGDTVTIPAVGITEAWILVLAIVGLVLVAVSIFRRRRR